MRVPHLLAAVVAGALLPASVVRAATPEPVESLRTSPVASTLPKRRARPPVVGLMADAGLPDGAIVALAVRPTGWLRLHGGAGTNSISAGVRGGMSLMLPFAVSPSLNADVGHYPAGRANGLVERIVGVNSSLGDLFRRVGYTYVNLHLGLEFGQRWATFFVHGGMSYARVRLADAGPALEDRINANGDHVSVNITGEPSVRVATPSVKLGVIFYLK